MEKKKQPITSGRRKEGRSEWERSWWPLLPSFSLYQCNQDSDYRITLSPLGLFFPDQLINLVLSKPTCIHPDTPVCNNHFPVDFRFPLSSVSLFFPIPSHTHTPFSLFVFLYSVLFPPPFLLRMRRRPRTLHTWEGHLDRLNNSILLLVSDSAQGR